jgi:formate hydrogenlyase transcriptional activator
MNDSALEARLMIDNIPTLAWSCHPDGTTEFLNQRWLDYTGLSMEQALGWGWKDPIHTEDLETLIETWQRVLYSGEPGEEEARLRRFDGEYRWFLFRAVPVRDEQGKVIRWYGTNTDIEDLKRAEHLLSAERQTLEMIADRADLALILGHLCSTVDAQARSIVSCVLLMDPDGNQLRPGPWSSIPNGWADIITPVAIGPSAGSCGAAAFLKKPVIVSDIASDPLSNEFRDVALANGLCSAWSQPLLSKDGQVLGTFGLYGKSARNPTDRELELLTRAAHLATIAIDAERSRAALTASLDEVRRSETQLRTILNAIPTQAWSALPDGAVDFLSQRWLNYYGLSLEDGKNRGWADLVHPEDLPAIVERWSASVATGEPYEHEVRARTVHGEYRWCMSRAIPTRDEAGRIVKWYGTTTDIEDYKRAEEQRTALQREVESERDRLRLLLDVHKALVANLDLPSLFKQLAVSLRRVTDCDLIGLSLPDPATGNLRQQFVDYRERRGVVTEGMMVPLHGSATGEAFRTRRLVCLNEGQASGPVPSIYETPEGQRFYELLLKEGVPAGYFLPLVYGDEVIAVMQLTKYGRGRSELPQLEVALKSQETEFLSALADQLAVAVAKALEHGALIASRDELAREQIYLREEIDLSSMFEEIVGSSATLRNVQKQVLRVAPSDSTVLILGETGTGKELIARAIYKRSKRLARPFVRVNCAAIPPCLIASELFGHEKGAFTGAVQRRVGRFELADGGTIFLDEIGELPAETQMALLRVLQEREFERVGSSQSISVDVRVIAATNRDLKGYVAAGGFRQDLFYRLNVFPIQIPSLRERADDIPLLVEYLIERYAKKAGKKIRNVSKRTLDLFQEYDWPGNIRELQNVVERSVLLCDGETFTVDETWLKAGSASDSRACGSLWNGPRRSRERDHRSRSR